MVGESRGTRSGLRYNIHMAKETKEKVKKTSNDGGNAVYVFGLFGALIYFVQQADGFGQILLGILKAIA